jgi:hypothetical protein
MTFCGYEDIYDFCRKTKYNYYFAEISNVSGSWVTNTSRLAPVLRQDDSTGETIRLDPTNNNSTLLPCDQYDSGDLISDWDCYLLWRDNNTPFDPPSSVYQAAQKLKIEQDYTNIINQGYSLAVNNNTISLPRDPASQINITNALVQSILEDKDPEIQDIKGNNITVPRKVLQTELPIYTKNNQLLEYTKNNAIATIETSTDISAIVNIKLETQVQGGYTCPAGYASDGAGGCVPNGFIP